MSLGILILGDIVGTPGRLAVSQCLPQLRERYQPDLVIANAENAANGSGLTPELFKKIRGYGVDAVTLGDHVYKKKQIVSTLEQESCIIRPANLPEQAAGRLWMALRTRGGQGRSVYVVTLLGRLFMNMPVNHPFAVIDQVLGQLPESDPIVLVEVHGEATSEKQALGWYLNGRASLVFGTHTHVPTADARILPAGLGPPSAQRARARHTGYITDLGMCGPYDSVLGRQIDRVITHMNTSMPSPFDVASGDPRVCGLFVRVGETDGSAEHVERVEQRANPQAAPFV